MPGELGGSAARRAVRAARPAGAVCSTRPAGAVGRAAGAVVARRGASGHGWLTKYYRDKELADALASERHASSIMPPVAVAGHVRARAWLEFHVSGASIGTVTVELADDLLPVTVDNFTRLITGDTKSAPPPRYEGTEVHQIFKNQFLLMGDTSHERGWGGHSAFEEPLFRDEGYFFRHSKPGVLSMANGGVHTNNSCFFITLDRLPHLDGRNVPFGAVVDGMDVVDRIGEEFIVKGRPVERITIAACGMVKQAEQQADVAATA